MNMTPHTKHPTDDLYAILGGAEHIAPHIAAQIIHEGSLIFSYGNTNAVFDLASLTKIFCVTALCAQACVEKRLQLDETPWPTWPDITIRHMLQHTSGLPAHIKFYEMIPQSYWGTIAGKHLFRSLLENVTPINPPDAQTVYSDLGFLALGFLLEDRYQSTLDVLMRNFQEKYQLHAAMGFLDDPYRAYLQRKKLEIYPTEGGICGMVHDENCAALGGIAGHAGLFGSVHAVAQWGQFFLQCITGQIDTPFAQQMQHFAQYQNATAGYRALGFDRQTTGGSTDGALSDTAVGHLGFTGTSVWLDPTAQICMVLLTNRVFYGRDPAPIRSLRQRFHRTAADFLRVNLSQTAQKTQ